AQPTPAPAALKTRQQAAWSSGNYAIVGATLQIVGEQLCEALDITAGSKVLDVAAGNGMASLAAARRWCDVTSTDYVPALLEQGRTREMADGATIEFKEADAENLPFADNSFDVVLFNFRYRSPEHFLEIFKTFYGPMLKAFAALEPGKQQQLHDDLHALIVRTNRATNGSMIVPSEYLEVVITKR